MVVSRIGPVKICVCGRIKRAMTDSAMCSVPPGPNRTAGNAMVPMRITCGIETVGLHGTTHWTSRPYPCRMAHRPTA